MSKRNLVFLFLFLLAFFTGIVKLVDLLANGEAVPFEITDMRFPVFWAGIGTWAIHAAKQRQRENSAK